MYIQWVRLPRFRLVKVCSLCGTEPPKAFLVSFLFHFWHFFQAAVCLQDLAQCSPWTLDAGSNSWSGQSWKSRRWWEASRKQLAHARSSTQDCAAWVQPAEFLCTIQRPLCKGPSGDSSSGPCIEFHRQWGEYSWFVKYSGKYDNDRPAHVALGDIHIKPGSQYTLSNLRKVYEDSVSSRGAVMWSVDDLYLANGELAHFTVHYGERPMEDFRWGRLVQHWFKQNEMLHVCEIICFLTIPSSLQHIWSDPWVLCERDSASDLRLHPVLAHHLGIRYSHHLHNKCLLNAQPASAAEFFFVDTSSGNWQC